VLGIDISTPMLEVGRARLGSLDINNVTFENKDAATYRFQGEAFDRIFSRFGVMFFIEPISAFCNIRDGLKSGGRLAFVCWQAADENPWIAVPLHVVLQHVPAPPPTDPEAPGPLAFSNPDRVLNILSEAGFAEITIDALETMVPVEADVPGSVQKLLEVGPVSRLLSDVSDDVMARIESDLFDAISEFQTADGVMMESATWIVSAISP
jgi:SAM-dependent methyltransferase